MIGVVIGTSKIATVHIRALLKKKLTKIYSVSRSKKKAINFLKRNNLQKYNIIPSNYQILKTTKKKFVSVCVNTKYHYECIKKISSKGSVILVEKPIISGIKYGNNYKDKLDNIYSIHKKLLVCYPMFFLAKSFKKNFTKIKKVNKIDVFYLTNGKHKFNEIGEDLLPHGVSLILGIINLKFSDNKPKNLKCLFSKNSWKGSFEINQIKFTLNFNENVKRYKSKFYFKINNELILRPTKIINDKFYNFLSYKNKTIEISNPMDDCLKYHLNNIKNLKNFKSNKRFTYYAMELNNKFLVNSFQKL